ncbi:MAG: Gfo/Idh/MocA family oxidoreductase [Candidatus Hydrogenedentes bacterium]|nr:Gfo/Idh/MocA family oxidoreductase [Candidatus Hydrogenedentota bacterium]
MSTINRREFIGKTTKTALATAAASTFSINVLGANERVVLCVAGIHGRGSWLAPEFAKRKDVHVKYLADPDSRLFPGMTKSIEDVGGGTPTCIQDFRKALEDPEVNGLVSATPNHWHALSTVWACQAGKDVYVEKPTCHNIWEGRKMIEAARKYNRVVMCGMQNRSAEYCFQAADYIKSGKLGEVHFVRVLNSKPRGTIGHREDSNPPEGVDYDLWLGPAPNRPFNENRFHYAWNWYWDFGAGDITNDGCHQVDIARWITGLTCPKSVYSSGGIQYFKDDQETPDTHSVIWDFDGVTMTYEQTLWTPYMRKMPIEQRDLDILPDWAWSGTRFEVYGSKEFMFFERHGGGWQTFDSDGKPSVTTQGGFANPEHMGNFIDCIRTRKTPNGDIAECHLSTSLCHYANASYRVGRKLTIDAATETFVNDDEANALLKREGRDPYKMPEVV